MQVQSLTTEADAQTGRLQIRAKVCQMQLNYVQT
jgi:hypothetical protein